jgi:hypothetical protein
LQTLILNHTMVTNAGLQFLAGLKSLHYLDLGETRVTSAGLDQLNRVRQAAGHARAHAGR